MKNLFSSKSTVGVVIVIIVVVVGYFYYEGSSSSSGSGSLLVSQPGDQSIGTAELNLLDQVQSLKIDTTLFQDPGYNALQDYSVAIPQENVGRPNPFAPYNGEVVAPVGTPGSASAPSPAGH